MRKNVADEIMLQSRHQFIYGYNTDERQSEIKKMVDEFPIKMDENAPMGIYLENAGIEADDLKSSVDKMLASSISREYLSFLIAYTLLERALEDNNFTQFPERVDLFLKSINRLLVQDGHPNIASLQELLTALKLGLEFYEMNYKIALDTGAFKGNFSDVPISFLSLDVFLRYFKKLLNNNSYVAVVMNLTKPISHYATQAINTHLSKRCNADLSMKVVCEPSDWKSYFDPVGVRIEAVHDYGEVELDESYKEYIRELKNKWSI